MEFTLHIILRSREAVTNEQASENPENNDDDDIDLALANLPIPVSLHWQFVTDTMEISPLVLIQPFRNITVSILWTIITSTIVTSGIRIRRFIRQKVINTSYLLYLQKFDQREKPLIYWFTYCCGVGHNKRITPTYSLRVVKGD